MRPRRTKQTHLLGQAFKMRRASDTNKDSGDSGNWWDEVLARTPEKPSKHAHDWQHDHDSPRDPHGLLKFFNCANGCGLILMERWVFVKGEWALKSTGIANGAKPFSMDKAEFEEAKREERERYYFD